MVIKRHPSAPCHLRQRWAMGRREKKHQAPRQVNLSTSQPQTQVPAQKGPRGPGAAAAGKARHGVGGVGWRGWGCRGRWGRRCGPRPERFPPAPPGLTHALMARASSRPAQARGRRRGRGRGSSGSHTRTRDWRRRPACLSPAARGGHSWRPQAGAPTSAAAGRLPLQPAARPARPRPDPGRQVPRSPGPREPPGRGRSVPPAPSSDVSVSRRRGKGRGERRNRPFLRRSPPAGIAAGGARARRSAAQRPGGAGGLASQRTPAPWAPPPRLPSLPFSSGDARPGDPSQQDPGIRRSEGAKASPFGERVRDEGGEPPSLSPPWGLSSTPISWGIPRSDLPLWVTPPLLSRRCSTCP